MTNIWKQTVQTVNEKDNYDKDDIYAVYNEKISFENFNNIYFVLKYSLNLLWIRPNESKKENVAKGFIKKGFL